MSFIYDFSFEKNEWLQKNRGISFEEIIAFLEHDGPLNIIKHPNQVDYPNQEIYVIQIKDYTYLVPFVTGTDGRIFLKTAFPNRQAHKKYTERNL